MAKHTANNTPAEPVYYHNCPALGPNTKVIKAYRGNAQGTVIYGWQHKCPFCSYEADEFHPNNGDVVIEGQ
jgi:hypothetical protein